MRKLYNEFFYIPKHGKIREKVMLTRVAMTIVIMVMCLAAMSITAYAYYSYNVTSGSNIIKAASFYTDVTVQITDANGNEVEVITSDYVSHLANGLEANKTYFVTIKHTERSTSQTGFVIVTAKGCETRYHTQQLGRDGDSKTLTITFAITPGDTTDVKFYSHWGTSRFYSDFMEVGENDERYILDGEEIQMTVNGVTPNSESCESVGSTDAAGETTTIPSTNATTGTDSSFSQTEESTTPPDDTTTATGTTEPTTSTTEPTTTQPSETTTGETTGIDTTEPAETESTVTTDPQPVTDTSETTGPSTTETNE